MKLARRIGKRVSRNAYRNLEEAAVEIDESRTGDEESLRALLEQLGLPVFDSVVDLERSLGGAVTDDGTFGVIHQLRAAIAVTRDLPMRRAMIDQVALSFEGERVFRTRDGRHPLSYLREDGRVLVAQAEEYPRLVFDSLLQQLEASYLMPRSPQNHEVVIEAAAGAALAELLGAERFAAASGERVDAYLGQDLGLIELRGQARQRADQLRTALTTTDRDAAVAALAWATGASLQVAWRGPP